MAVRQNVAVLVASQQYSYPLTREETVYTENKVFDEAKQLYYYITLFGVSDGKIKNVDQN